MTDKQLDNKGYDSKARVAYDLMTYTTKLDISAQYNTKEKILDLYAECLLTVETPRLRKKK